MHFVNYNEESGLMKLDEHSYYYSDRFGKVLFKTVETKGTEGLYFSRKILPFFAIFTGPPDDDRNGDFYFIGEASKHYRFVGNEKLINDTLEMLDVSNLNVQVQTQEIDYKYSTLFYNIALSNPSNIAEIGDVFPVLTIKNSYNKTIKESISYGFGMYNEGRFYSYTSSKLFGQFSRRHMNNSLTREKNFILDGVEKLVDDIPFVCSEMANFTVNQDEIIAIIETVEALGKKRHEALVSLVQSFNENNISVWKIFIAILKFISVEKNFNARRVLENIAEKIIILPTKISNAINN